MPFKRHLTESQLAKSCGNYFVYEAGASMVKKKVYKRLPSDRPLLHRHREDHHPHREDGQHRAEEQHGTGLTIWTF